MRKYKYDLFDTYEAHKPSNQSFIAKHYRISQKRSGFHMRNGYVDHGEVGQRSTNFGVDKRMYYATPCGVLFDGQFAGKTDE
jgi:hypothetical protein